MREDIGFHLENQDLERRSWLKLMHIERENYYMELRKRIERIEALLEIEAMIEVNKDEDTQEKQ